MTDRDAYHEPEYLSIGEAARLLGVSVDTVRRWEREDRIECIRTLGNQRRFTRAEVERVKAGGSGVIRVGSATALVPTPAGFVPVNLTPRDAECATAPYDCPHVPVTPVRDVRASR